MRFNFGATFAGLLAILPSAVYAGDDDWESPVVCILFQYFLFKCMCIITDRYKVYTFLPVPPANSPYSSTGGVSSLYI
jgi:hypothetical protein